MSLSGDAPTGEPDVYARLAEQQEHQFTRSHPPRWAKPFGWLLVVAIVGSVLAAALEVRPW